MHRLAVPLALLGALAAPAPADTIHLKGGGALRHARVVAERGDTVELEVRAGGRVARVVLGRDEIERIERDAPDAASPERPPELDRAFALLREGKPVEAMILLKRLPAQGPWHAPARYGRSLAHEQLGDLPAAEREIGLARTVAPQDPWIAFHEAHLLHRAGRFAAAERGYRLAHALSPEDPALKQLAREAIAAARAGVAAPDPAAARARAAFDAAAGNVADAAEASRAVVGSPQLVLRAVCRGLHVRCEAPPAVLHAYARGADAEGFRRAVTGVRATLAVGPEFATASAADRAMCLRQVHSALAHRYPHAAVVVEAREGERVRAACFFDGTEVRVAFDPAPAQARAR